MKPIPGPLDWRRMSAASIGFNDEQRREQACRMYKAGASLADIALALHRSVNEVRGLIGMRADQARLAL
jgi:hypothetical protein